MSRRTRERLFSMVVWIGIIAFVTTVALNPMPDPSMMAEHEDCEMCRSWSKVPVSAEDAAKLEQEALARRTERRLVMQRAER